jgi:outer membrane lipoprotein SlyB
MMFGHWVDSDLGPLVVGGVNGIAVRVQQQQQDGALYVMRDDGQRRMMIENILCASPDNWRATVGQIDLAAVRAARAKEVWVVCVLPKIGGHVACSPPYFKPE